MKKLRKYIDKIKPNFEKGGKYEFLKSTFEAFETFLFVPDKVTYSGCHIRDAIDTKRLMTTVIIALFPPLLFGIWNTGYQHYLFIGENKSLIETFWYGFLKVFPIIAVTYITGLSIEFLFAQLRDHEVNEGFLVTGLLIPLVLPVNIPLWMVAIATAFAVIFSKEVFGGTGMNIFNPALIARAFLFFAFPAEMSGDKAWIAGIKEITIDGKTGATILGQAHLGNAQFVNPVNQSISPIDMFIGTIPGSIGETSKLAILIGAFILIFTGIGSFKTMISFISGGFIVALIMNFFATNAIMSIPAWQHLLIGGFAFGAVYMITDPVSSAHTEKGKIIYGFLGGALAMLIRNLNPAYPEGVMLGILLANAFAPLIDYFVIESNINRRLNRVKK